MKESPNWYWTPDLRIVSNVAQSNGISQVDECRDLAYLEAEKERLQTKRQEWVEGASFATNTIRAVYFEELLKEVDYQLEYVEQRLSKLREPTELLESKLLEDKCDAMISSSKTRRHKGDGSGCIYWRTITKNGKDYQQAYYQYELWEKGVAAAHAPRDRLIKSSKYIPKSKLAQVQQLDNDKVPVREILELLDKGRCRTW